VKTDTIVALATPPGRGGIGVVRCSGATVPALAHRLLGRLPVPRQAQFGAFRAATGEILDHGLALYFPAPHSFTGEAVLELHGHGSPLVLDRIIQEILHLGARLARPGEFSERAFINGKIDLVQAEAIADLIDSVSIQAARCALRSLQGEFSRHIDHLGERLVYLRTYIEAGIDFPDEELDLLADGQVFADLNALRAELQDTLARAQQGRVLREGMRLVIVGRPNAGKSSLLNCLAERDVAIVTPQAGTTRDIVRDTISIDGMPVHIMDTAGLRDSDDVIEQEGIRRAHLAVNEADVVIILADERDSRSTAALQAVRELAALPPTCVALLVANKCDLSATSPGRDSNGVIHLSARTGAGIDTLKAELKACMGLQSEESALFMARRRHLDALERCAEALAQACAQAATGRSELLAEELRQAHHALGEITGQFSSEDLLASIFAGFCIGK
jgi:tRNA modification GTPase